MKGILAFFADAQSDISNKINNDLPNNGGVTADTLLNILYWVYGAAGLIAVAVIVYGGIKYIMSQGDPGKTKQASQILAYAVIGLVVVLLAGAITAFATGMIGGATE